MPHTHDSKPFVFHRGPLIVSCESLYWHWAQYPSRFMTWTKPPLTERAESREYEQPYRVGHARIVRFPFTRKGIAVGYWEPAGAPVLAEEESEKILQAVAGVHIEGVTATDIANWARARDLTRLQRILRRLLGWLALPNPTVARHDDLEDGMPGWQAEEGWSVLPWDPSQDVIDLEQARSRPRPGDGAA